MKTPEQGAAISVKKLCQLWFWGLPVDCKTTFANDINRAKWRLLAHRHTPIWRSLMFFDLSQNVPKTTVFETVSKLTLLSRF